MPESEEAEELQFRFKEFINALMINVLDLMGLKVPCNST
jgi:hypothetical protein